MGISSFSFFYLIILILLIKLSVLCETTNLYLFKSNFHKIAKRRSAFQLAYIEATFEKEERDKNRLSNLSKDGEDDEICKERCNDMLRKGLDMVKAHLGFASISVPPVVDEYDLLLYCRLDLQHDGCLRKCGFTVQFNMRDFVCKNNYKTMKAMLPCYRYASTRIMNECGAKRCGTLNTSDASFDGYGNRCRVLSCDLNCIQNILIANCGEEYGKQATSLLVQYVRQQINYWTKILNPKAMENRLEKLPQHCKSLLIQRL